MASVKCGLNPMVRHFRYQQINAYKFYNDFLDFVGNLPANRLRQKNDGEYVAGFDL